MLLDTCSHRVVPAMVENTVSRLNCLNLNCSGLPQALCPERRALLKGPYSRELTLKWNLWRGNQLQFHLSLCRVRNGSLLLYSCLENSMDRGTWQAVVPGVAKSRTWWSDWACMLSFWVKWEKTSFPYLPSLFWMKEEFSAVFFFNLFIFKLKDNCLTEFFCFLSNLNMNQP